MASLEQRIERGLRAMADARKDVEEAIDIAKDSKGAIADQSLLSLERRLREEIEESAKARDSLNDLINEQLSKPEGI